MVGEIFERLTVVERRGNDKHGKKLWLCKCSCGGSTVTTTSDLRTGNTKSCGCYGLMKNIESKTKHGRSKSPIYAVWKSIVQRCTNPNNQRWEDYGGRGIGIEPSWVDKDRGFENFLQHVGERPEGPEKMALDRIDNDKGYLIGNVRWVNYSVNVRNSRKCPTLEINGKVKRVSEWAIELKLSPAKFSSDLKKGLSVEEILKKKGRENELQNL